MGAARKSAVSDCTGACCAVFYLPHTITHFRKNKETIQDGEYIADMVIPLTPKEARERAGQFGSSAEPKWDSRGHHFTCRHWDEKTRLCKAYDARPAMCRNYPYGEPCPLGRDCRVGVMTDTPATLETS